MVSINELTDLFVRYGYETDKTEEGRYAIFSSGTSMYPAVEIVKLENAVDEEITELKRSYSESGYAVRICEDKTISEIEHYLFNWFFQVRESNSRITNKYKEYTDSIMNAYAFQGACSTNKGYEYINIPYIVERDFDKQEGFQDGLVDSIIQDLKKNGPQLIIVEAGAGFGKTSTAYEILNSFNGITENIRPFFMELSKDRNAPTFRYLLLSQIDSNFKVRLGSDIVLYNIKRGNIPLIIDGFDELLSRDLDNGMLDAKFSNVETMLSTIADLLTDQAKVVLTTRKTAIFAGENFYEWYEKLHSEGKCFQVVRYQLGLPSLNDWLPYRRSSKLPPNFEKISNPVILGYLRYLDEEQFKEAVQSTSLTDNYFNSILQREKERQDLPFNVGEQKSILERLASYFAGFNASSFTRPEVKDAILELSKTLIEANTTTVKDAKSIANTLTNHAFLDRKGDSSIGFLNDFIFGTFFMLAITEENDSFFTDFFKSASYSFVEKAIIAGSVCSKDKREKFWNQLGKKCEMTPILHFWSDVLLREQTVHIFENISLDEKHLSNVLLGSEEYPIINCSFSNMYFKDCIFDFNNITNCTFINCKFEKCTKDGQNYECGFYGCSSQDNFIDEHENEEQIETEECEVNTFVKILKLYFKVDGRTPRMRMISKIKDKFDAKIFRRSFNLLINKGYILTNGDKSFISQQGIDYLKTI